MDKVGKGGSGAWAFGGPGAGEGSGGAVLTSTGAQTSLEAGVGPEEKQGKTHVLSSSSAGTPGGADRKRSNPSPLAAPARLGPWRGPRTRAPVAYPPTARSAFLPPSHSSRPRRPRAGPPVLSFLPQMPGAWAWFTAEASSTVSIWSTGPEVVQTTPWEGRARDSGAVTFSAAGGAPAARGSPPASQALLALWAPGLCYSTL